MWARSVHSRAPTASKIDAEITDFFGKVKIDLLSAES